MAQSIAHLSALAELDPTGALKAVFKLVEVTITLCQTASTNEHRAKLLQSRLQVLHSLLSAAQTQRPVPLQPNTVTNLIAALEQTQNLLCNWNKCGSSRVRRILRTLKAESFAQEFEDVMLVVNACVQDLAACASLDVRAQVQVLMGNMQDAEATQQAERADAQALVQSLLEAANHSTEQLQGMLVAEGASLEALLPALQQLGCSVEPLMVGMQALQSGVEAVDSRLTNMAGRMSSKFRNIDSKIDQIIAQISQVKAARDHGDLRPRLPKPCLEKSALHNMQPHCVGAGGFADIFLAELHGATVAVKQARSRIKHSAQMTRRTLLREAYIMSKLRSPRVVQFFGIVPDMNHALVMEYMPKGSLHDYLMELKSMAGVLVDGMLVDCGVHRLQLALETVQALDFLHNGTQFGHVIHGDLKTGNLLVDAEGRVKLADFGCSLIPDSDTRSLSTATAQSAMSSPSELSGVYSAPEQLQVCFAGGRSSSDDSDGSSSSAELSPPRNIQTDVYSLGAVLFEIFTCSVPFSHLKWGVHDVRTLAAICRGKKKPLFEPLRKQSVAVCMLVEQCMARNPADRPPLRHVDNTLKQLLSLARSPLPGALQLNMTDDSATELDVCGGRESVAAGAASTLVPSEACAATTGIDSVVSPEVQEPTVTTESPSVHAEKVVSASASSMDGLVTLGAVAAEKEVSIAATSTGILAEAADQASATASSTDSRATAAEKEASTMASSTDNLAVAADQEDSAATSSTDIPAAAEKEASRIASSTDVPAAAADQEASRIESSTDVQAAAADQEDSEAASGTNLVAVQVSHERAESESHSSTRALYRSLSAVLADSVIASPEVAELPPPAPRAEPPVLPTGRPGLSATSAPPLPTNHPSISEPEVIRLTGGDLHPLSMASPAPSKDTVLSAPPALYRSLDSPPKQNDAFLAYISQLETRQQSENNEVHSPQADCAHADCAVEEVLDLLNNTVSMCTIKDDTDADKATEDDARTDCAVIEEVQDDTYAHNDAEETAEAEDSAHADGAAEALQDNVTAERTSGSSSTFHLIKRKAWGWMFGGRKGQAAQGTRWTKSNSQAAKWGAPESSHSKASPGSGAKVVYVGIDLGSSRTGYAYALDNARPIIQTNYPGEPKPTPKTTVALLYHVQPSGDWVPKHWGMEAYVQYHKLPMQDRGNYRYVTRFKLALLDDSEVFPLPKDCPFDSITIVSHFLVFIVKHVYQTLDRACGNNYTKENMAWSLTVPAHVSNKGKNRLMQAAYKAGIGPHSGSERVVLVPKPEAALWTVREQRELSLRARDVVLVVDAGAGTVDITLHTVLDPDSPFRPVLSEATHRDGLLAGSGFIDEEFSRYFFRRIGEEVCYQWYRKYPEDMINMIREQWERLKRNFTGEETELQEHIIDLPITLFKMLPPATRSQLADEQDGDDSCLIIPQSTMEGFFKTVVDRIITLIMDQVTRSRAEPDHILLIGGLGSSEYLQTRMMKHFEQILDNAPRPVLSKMPNLVTTLFGCYAMEGCVLLAQQRPMVYQRTIRLTYGVETSAIWEPGAPNRIFDPASNQYMTNKFFSKFITVDQAVTTEDVFVKKFRPLYTDQTMLTFDLYSSENPDVKYTTDPGVSQVGSVNIPIDIPPNGTVNDGAVKVFIRFGKTDLIVQAVQERTGQSIDAQVTMASSAG